MTTFLPFAPVFNPANPPWIGSVTLDGNAYTLTAWFSVYAQRWYIYLNAIDGTLVFLKPMIGSPAVAPLLSLVWETGSLPTPVQPVSVDGIFEPLPSSSQTGLVIATADGSLDFGIEPGSVVNLTVSGTVPAEFGGTFACVVLNDDTFSYPMVENPGTPAATPGSFSYDVNLVEGYFTRSTLVWRPSSGLFEVNP